MNASQIHSRRAIIYTRIDYGIECKNHLDFEDKNKTIQEMCVYELLGPWMPDPSKGIKIEDLTYGRVLEQRQKTSNRLKECKSTVCRDESLGSIYGRGCNSFSPSCYFLLLALCRV